MTFAGLHADVDMQEDTALCKAASAVIKPRQLQCNCSRAARHMPCSTVLDPIRRQAMPCVKYHTALMTSVKALWCLQLRMSCARAGGGTQQGVLGKHGVLLQAQEAAQLQPHSPQLVHIDLERVREVDEHEGLALLPADHVQARRSHLTAHTHTHWACECDPPCLALVMLAVKVGCQLAVLKDCNACKAGKHMLCSA